VGSEKLWRHDFHQQQAHATWHLRFIQLWPTHTTLHTPAQECCMCSNRAIRRLPYDAHKRAQKLCRRATWVVMQSCCSDKL
jgi:hypothetical protein